MTWPSPNLPLPTDQTNATVQFDRHPTEHSLIGQVINNDITPQINAMVDQTLDQRVKMIGRASGVEQVDGTNLVGGFNFSAAADHVYRTCVTVNSGQSSSTSNVRLTIEIDDGTSTLTTANQTIPGTFGFVNMYAEHIDYGLTPAFPETIRRFSLISSSGPINNVAWVLAIYDMGVQEPV